MTNHQLSEILKMSVPERVKLAQIVWDSVAAIPSPIRISESEQKELDRRLESYLRNSHTTLPWKKVKARILRKT